MHSKLMKEIYNINNIELDQGIIYFTNLYKDGSLYIKDMYIKEEFRGTGVAYTLLDMMIKQMNPNKVISCVNLDSGNPEASILAHIKANFKVKSLHGTSITLEKQVI